MMHEYRMYYSFRLCRISTIYKPPSTNSRLSVILVYLILMLASSYTKIVNYPIDLGTVRQRIRSRRFYKRLSDVRCDTQKIFDNFEAIPNTPHHSSYPSPCIYEICLTIFGKIICFRQTIIRCSRFSRHLETSEEKEDHLNRKKILVTTFFRRWGK